MLAHSLQISPESVHYVTSTEVTTYVATMLHEILRILEYLGLHHYSFTNQNALWQMTVKHSFSYQISCIMLPLYSGWETGNLTSFEFIRAPLSLLQCTKFAFGMRNWTCGMLFMPHFSFDLYMLTSLCSKTNRQKTANFTEFWTSGSAICCPQVRGRFEKKLNFTLFSNSAFSVGVT